jgi:ABC-type nitrate/sulfonate/bicarbonate transport system substrate-binding protein
MYETAQPLMQALVQGQIDVAGYTALPITYNGMQRSGKELYFSGLMIEDQDHRISYLLKRKGASNISGISDLRGKTVGILPTVAYKAWLESMLMAEGIPIESVKIQQIAPTLQAQALKSGGVDVLFTNDPVATASIRNGFAELATSEVSVPKYLGEPFVFGSFNISKEWADANPELSKRIVAALDEAIAYINANPDAAKEAMKPYLAEAFREDVAAYPAARYLSSKDTTDALLQQAADLYLKIGIIPEPLKLSDVVLK